MHVAFWSPAWPLAKHPNGIITYVHAVRQELERRGHRVSVFTASLDQSAGDNHAFEVRRSRWRGLANRLSRGAPESAAFDLAFDISSAILREHRRRPIDIVEMEESFGWCAEVQSRTSLPMVVKLHGPAFLTMVEGDRETPFGREKIQREGRSLARCPMIVSPSEANLRRTVERYGLTQRLTRIIANPMVIDSRTPMWRLEGCDQKTILFVGRFDRVKGADVVLRAFSLVLRDIPEAKLIFVGPDNGLLLSNGSKVQFLAYSSSVLTPEARSKISFLGQIPHNQVAALRASAMVTVVASRWESQCYTLLEAMAQGCPIVSTDAGACPESIIPQTTGLLARCEDPDDFAEKICAMLRDPQGAVSMGRAAREHVLRRHAASPVVDAMLECYEQVIQIHHDPKGLSPTRSSI